MWLAQDSDGSRYLYANKPHLENDKDEETGAVSQYWIAGDDDVAFLEMEIPADFHPEVDFEHSPRLVEVSPSDLLAFLRKHQDDIIARYESRAENDLVRMLSCEMGEFTGRMYALAHIIAALRCMLERKGGADDA